MKAVRAFVQAHSSFSRSGSSAPSTRESPSVASSEGRPVARRTLLGILSKTLRLLGAAAMAALRVLGFLLAAAGTQGSETKPPPLPADTLHRPGPEKRHT